VKRILDRFISESGGRWKECGELVEKLRLPNRKRAIIYLERLRDALGGVFPDYLDGDFLPNLIELFSFSAFMAGFFVRHPELIGNLKEIYRKRMEPEDFKVEAVEDEREFKRRIRLFKNLQMARVILRDILKLSPIVELMRDVTLINDAVLRATLSFAYRELSKKYGEPESSTFCVVDMGKAGGFELNYASDIDIMYIYSSRYGMTSGGRLGKLSNHEFFTLLSERITSILTEKTEDGICLNVDLRLRPNGTMGPLCNDFQALENYYTAVARPWERFALLKARPSAGDVGGTGIEFLKLANQFVYRKYVDLTLIEEVLRLKELIKSKVARKGAKIDLKLGRGGIREIEFIVQAFQIIYGGKNRRIRSMHTIKALEKLRKWGFLTEKEHYTLLDAYTFLRRAEHMLQITNFRQTQTFHPESEEAEELAAKMGFRSRSDFLSSLKERMDKVNQLFNRFFPTGETKTISTITVSDLEKEGFRKPEVVKHFLESLLNLKNLTPDEKNRIDVLGSRLIESISDLPNGEQAVKNLLSFLEREEGKVFFLSLLPEQNAVKVLLQLLSLKDFFIKRFRQTPEVLDYMLSPEGIEIERSEERVRETIENLKNLKLSKNLEELRVIIRKLLGHVGTVGFMDELTCITDAVVRSVFSSEDWKFSLFSVGKYGSRELNVGSDLDLLLVGRCSGEMAVKFINRLKELGYEVDTRLRPFGEKGELVFTVEYFTQYAKTVARTWEKLAYTRFRFIAGDEETGNLMEKAVNNFLFREPLNLQVLGEILAMRERLERELSKGEDDVKYAEGGIVDLEFIGYTYQLMRKVKLGSTYRAILKLSEENPRFSELMNLYTTLREADTEKRLYGELLSYRDLVPEVKERTRKAYLEFMEWARSSLSTQGR